MLEITERIYANENEAYVVGDNDKGGAVVKKFGQWGFLTKSLLADDGNLAALAVLKSILPSGMTIKTESAAYFNSALGIRAVVKGERGENEIPLVQVAKAWLQILGANGFNESAAKAELKRQKVVDDQGNPGQWVKGIE